MQSSSWAAIEFKTDYWFESHVANLKFVSQNSIFTLQEIASQRWLTPLCELQQQVWQLAAVNNVQPALRSQSPDGSNKDSKPECCEKSICFIKCSAMKSQSWPNSYCKYQTTDWKNWQGELQISAVCDV